MLFSRSLIASALMGFAVATTGVASAQSSLSTGSVAAGGNAPAGMAPTHVIQVGGPNGSLVFSPNNVQAKAGDLIQFQFHAKNHSVVQSTFDQPCVPIQNMMANKTDAFFSGFMPTNASFAATSNVLTYTIRVKDTKPMWFYCSQGKHCQAGMVGAVNAPSSGNKTMAAFVALAAQATENLSPGQASGSGSTGGAGGSGGSGSGGAGGAGGNNPSGTTGGNTPIAPSGSSGANPAQQSINAAPVVSTQSLFGLGAAFAAAFAML